MMKLLIAVTMIMAALIGPSVALNPQYNIEISTCEGDGMGDRSLFFGDYTYENGWRVWEMETTVNGATFWLDGSGAVQYLGDPLEIYAERGIQYYLYQVDEFGEPVTGNYEGHTVEVHLQPCVVEPPVCECEPNDPGDNIRITAPTTIGQTVRSQWLPPGGNGNWQVRMYIDGVKTSRWNGEYPIEVIAKELDENWVPTGFEISDCICG